MTRQRCDWCKMKTRRDDNKAGTIICARCLDKDELELYEHGAEDAIRNARHNFAENITEAIRP